MKKVIAVILAVILSAGCVYAEDLADLKARAEQGDADAINKIGVLYYDGDELEQNYAEALSYFNKAAELGNADAYDNLGWMYENGDGVAEDLPKALEFYKKGAEGGVLRIL